MMHSKLDLKSTINNDENPVTQIIHFEGGIKRTFDGILPETIKQGQFTKMERTNGSLLLINDDKVLCVEVFGEK